MRAMEIGRVLEAAEIPATARDAGAVGDSRIYIVEAPDREHCDQWFRRLFGVTDGPFPVVVGQWMLEDDDRGRLVDEERAQSILVGARQRLETLDRWRAAPEVATGPNRVHAVLAWREAHPDGAAVETLIAAIAAAPVGTWAMPPARHVERSGKKGRVQPFMRGDDVRIALFPVAAGHEVLARFGFGGWNACPRAEHHVACAMRWERDLGARLVYLSHDAYAYAVARPPASDEDLLRLADEQAHLAADERPDEATLHSSRLWYFWWD
jgi:hypothetical protein